MSFGFYGTDNLFDCSWRTLVFFIILSPVPVRSYPTAFRFNYHSTTKMPIKDITNEEKSNLYMIGKKPKEVQRISESERGISVVDIFCYEQ